MANLKISQLPTAATATTADELAVVNGGVTSKITIDDIANLTAFGTSGNTSGTCISDIFVSNVNSCSPLGIFDAGRQVAIFEYTNGFQLVDGVNMVLPPNSEIVDSVGAPIVSKESTSDSLTNSYGSGLAKSEWVIGDSLSDYKTVISGTSSGTTGTTLHSKTISLPTNQNQSAKTEWIVTFPTKRYANNIELSDGINTLSTNKVLSGSTTASTATTIFSTTHDFIDSSITNTMRNACFSNVNQYPLIPCPNITELTSKTDYDFDGLIITETISGTSTATTATTRVVKFFDVTTGELEERIMDVSGSILYQSNASGGGGASCTTNAECQSALPSGTRLKSICVGGKCQTDWATEVVLSVSDGGDVFTTTQGITDGLRYVQGFDGNTGIVNIKTQNFTDGITTNTIKDILTNSNLDNIFEYNTTSLVTTETISGATSGFTGSTMMVKTTNDLINGNFKHEFINDDFNIVNSIDTTGCCWKKEDPLCTANWCTVVKTTCPKENSSLSSREFDTDITAGEGAMFIKTKDFNGGTTTNRTYWGGDSYNPTYDSFIEIKDYSKTGLLVTNTDTAGNTGQTGTTKFITTSDFLLGIKSNSINNGYWDDGFTSEYWSGDLYKTVLSGSSTAITATTTVITSTDMVAGTQGENVSWVDSAGTLLPGSTTFTSQKTYDKTNLLLIDSYTGTLGGTTPKPIVHEYDIANGIATLKINGTTSLIATTTDITSPKIISSKGVFTFGDTATPIPANVDSAGSEGQMVCDGAFIYVYSSGDWKRVTLSAWV